jgi:hypothetical protein
MTTLAGSHDDAMRRAVSEFREWTSFCAGCAAQMDAEQPRARDAPAAAASGAKGVGPPRRH